MSQSDGADFIQQWVQRDAANPEAHLGSIGLTHRVPSGGFVMGSRFHPREAPRREVQVAEFEIAHAPVMVRQYAAFLEAGGYSERPWWSEAGWAWRQGRALGWGRADRSRPFDWRSQESRFDHPVAGVTYYEAEAYCRWLSAQKTRLVRLPTEAEWEKAARGEYGKVYPWGDEWDPARCNSAEKGPGTTTPVGAYSPQGDSPYGAADMAGNVREWTRSKFKNYPYDAGDGRESLEGQESRMLRGGSFYDYRRVVRCAYRGNYRPGGRDGDVGFRVMVWSPGPARSAG